MKWPPTIVNKRMKNEEKGMTIIFLSVRVCGEGGATLGEDKMCDEEEQEVRIYDEEAEERGG